MANCTMAAPTQADGGVGSKNEPASQGMTGGLSGSGCTR
jgi:hypothetical protein